MSITNRLSLFFVAALAVVLIGFSATLYGLATWHLHRQLDQHLQSAMHILIASIEVHHEDVEWEPLERNVTLGDDPDLTNVRWTLRDERNQLVDCSENLKDQTLSTLPVDGPEWRTLSRQIVAGHFDAESVETPLTSATPEAIAALPSNRTAKRNSFVLSVALSEAPVRATLANLAMSMVAVSAAIWCAAAFAGRWLCKRALLPVTQMASKARTLQQSPECQMLLDVPPQQDELNELGQAFNQLLVTLRDSIERQQRFAGDASHQLRTPLTALLAAVDVAARQQRSPEEYQRILGVVQRRGRELQQIVEILLDLTRQTSGTESIPSERIELNTWCQKQMEAWQDHARARDFVLRLSSQALFVRLQPTLLRQVFDNLLENACKYTADGSPITIRTQMHTLQAIISIEDQGEGIPAEDLEHLFEPFFRSASARYSGEAGLGLGLTVAQRLATVFHGRIQVESSRGQGSTFRLALPLAVDGRAWTQDLFASNADQTDENPPKMKK